MFTHRPAVKVCVPFICGILAGKYIALPLFLLLSLGVCFLVLLLLFRGRPNVAVLLAATLILLLGMLRMRFDDSFSGSDDVARFVSPGAMVLLEGTLCDAPHLSSKTLRFTVDAGRLAEGGLVRSVSGTVLVSAWRDACDTSALPSLSYGRKVLLAGELQHPRKARNPGEFDLANYLHLNGIETVFYLQRFDSSCIEDEVRSSVASLLVAPVRRSLSDRLERLIGGQEGLFLKGLIVGERTEVPLEVETAFINAGVMHIIAVSGLHVVIVVLMLMMLFKSLRIPEMPRDCLICLLLVYYIYLTGAAPSVARSCIMAIIFMGAKLLQRRSDMYNTLAVSALLLLALDARQLFQPGFQLSYAAVFSLVFFYPRIVSMKSLLPENLQEKKVVTAGFAVVGVSVAASIGTLPFTAACFGQISIIGFVTNIIAVPLSNVILALGMFTLAVSAVWWWLASFFAETVSLLTWLLLWIVHVLGGVSFASVPMGMGISGGVMYYGCVLALCQMGRREVRKWSLISFLAVANIWVVYSLLAGRGEEHLRVIFLDVGQGDAILLELPGGKNLLVDAGPRNTASDAGERFILPYLRRSGIRHIERILISHLHGDHIGGVPAILRGVSVGEVIDAGSRSGSGVFAEFLRLVDSLNIPRRKVAAGDRVGDSTGNVRLYVLHPSGRFLPGDSAGRTTMNNQSIVLKLTYGATSLLLPGDAERPAQAWMAARYGDFLRCGAMKLPHHGSQNGYSPDVVSIIRPSVAVISVGLKNAFGHPSGDVLKALHERGCLIRRTDESGAVILESDGREWSLVEWR